MMHWTCIGKGRACLHDGRWHRSGPRVAPIVRPPAGRRCCVPLKTDRSHGRFPRLRRSSGRAGPSPCPGGGWVVDLALGGESRPYVDGGGGGVVGTRSIHRGGGVVAARLSLPVPPQEIRPRTGWARPEGPRRPRPAPPRQLGSAQLGSARAHVGSTGPPAAALPSNQSTIGARGMPFSWQ